MREDQRRVLEAWGFDPDHAERHYCLNKAARQAALAMRADMPREWAYGVLEMLRMCWARSEPWDVELQGDEVCQIFGRDVQDEMAYWIWDRHPELFLENKQGCLVLIFNPRGFKKIGPCRVPGWEG